MLSKFWLFGSVRFCEFKIFSPIISKFRPLYYWSYLLFRSPVWLVWILEFVLPDNFCNFFCCNFRYFLKWYVLGTPRFPTTNSLGKDLFSNQYFWQSVFLFDIRWRCLRHIKMFFASSHFSGTISSLYKNLSNCTFCSLFFLYRQSFKMHTWSLKFIVKEKAALKKLKDFKKQSELPFDDDRRKLNWEMLQGERAIRCYGGTEELKTNLIFCPQK